MQITGSTGGRPRPVRLLRLAGLAALMTAGLAMAGATPGVAQESGARIVGGSAARAGDWPWQVALVRSGRNGGQFCGGSVIGPRWVLTAAHCVKRRVPEGIQVLVGTRDLERGGRRIDVREILVHGDYERARKGNDIAVLRLAEPTGVAAVALPAARRMAQIAAPGTRATAIGWGLLRPLRCEAGVRQGTHRCERDDGVRGHYVDDETGRPVDPSDVFTSRLMQVELPLVSEGDCRAAYEDDSIAEIDRRTLCAGLRKGGKDSCQGDSGGPLVVRDGARWVQAGVVSWGISCARPGRYGVYTNVAAFAGWLRDRTGIAPDDETGDEAAGSTAEVPDVRRATGRC